jgi:hypothetical protein
MARYTEAVDYEQYSEERRLAVRGGGHSEDARHGSYGGDRQNRTGPEPIDG